MTYFEFAHPYLLLGLLVLPLWWWAHRWTRQGSLLIPKLAGTDVLPRGKKPSMCLRWIRFLALFAALLALARPQLGGRYSEVQASGIDIVLALDLSGSMLALDFSVDEKNVVTRLGVAQAVVRDFIEKRPADRMGLIAFGGNPYLVSPLTLNHDWLLKNLERLQVGAIEDGTAIGSALGMAINRLRNIQSKSKIIILLTDGCNNAGVISPQVASEAAANYGIKIYTIAVGRGGEVPTLHLNGQGKIATNVWGQPDVVNYYFPVDEATLKQVAEATQGQFFHAFDSKELKSIYDVIDTLEKTDVKLKQYTQHAECGHWFIAAAVLLLLLEQVLAYSRYRRLP